VDPYVWISVIFTLSCRCDTFKTNGKEIATTAIARRSYYNSIAPALDRIATRVLLSIAKILAIVKHCSKLTQY